MWKSPERHSSQRNRTSGPVENKNSHGITQSVMAKNKSTLKLIYYDQKQRSNKESQRDIGTTSKTSKVRKEKVRFQVAEISQRKKGDCHGIGSK